MKTKVIIEATIAIEIDEVWEESAPIKQINDDAMRAAQSKILGLRKDFVISSIKHSKTLMYNENK